MTSDNFTDTSPWRSWLNAVASPETKTDEWGTVTEYQWGADLDEAIGRLRADDPTMDATFRIAEEGGIVLLSLRYQEGRTLPALEALSHNGGDEDYVIIATVSDEDVWDDSERVAEKLSPCQPEHHRTPTWAIRFACHA